MKRFVCLVTAGMLLFGSSAFADTLKLEDVISKAVLNSRQLKLDDANVVSAQKVYDTAVKDANAVYIWSEKDAAYRTARQKEKELTPEQRKYEYELSKKTRQIDEEKLKQDIYTAYYGVMKANNDNAYKQKEANYAKLKMDVATAKYRKGLLSKNDYKLAQIAKKNADNQLKLSQRERKKVISKFYKAIGEGYHPDIQPLDTEFKYSDMSGVNLEDAIKNALKNRIEIYSANEDIRLKELELDIVDDNYDEGDYEYEDAKNNKEEAEFNLETKDFDIDFEIRTAYNNLLNMLDTIEINRQEKDKADINYGAAKAKYQLGMLTDAELTEVDLARIKANNDLDSSIMDYIVAREKFEAAQDIGPVAPVQ